MTPAPQNDTTGVKALAAATLASQDTSTTQQDVNREDQNVRLRTRHKPTRPVTKILRKSLPDPRAAGFSQQTDNLGRNKEFAAVLRAAMNRAGFTPSDLAAKAWGRTTDTRGYSVAKNRDRIGHYLAGGSFPGPENLERLAKALGVPVEALASTRPPPDETPERRPPRQSASSPFTNILITTDLPERPGRKMRLQVDKMLDWKLVTQIQLMILEAETADATADLEINPDVGKVVGGNNIENNGTK